MGREQLHNKIDQLGDPEALVVERVVDAELLDTLPSMKRAPKGTE